VRAERRANHRLTSTHSASQRRISSVTASKRNEKTHTTTVSTQSTASRERTTLKLQASPEISREAAVQLLRPHCSRRRRRHELARERLVGDVELRTHGLALEVANDDGVRRNRRRATPVGRGAGGEKEVLRRDETEPARARPCVAVDRRTVELRERCELCVVKRFARVPDEAVDLGEYSPRWHVGLAALPCSS
jgi:hypothetical protein